MAQLPTLDVTASNGVPFRVVYVPSDTEGPNPYRSRQYRNGRSGVEFFDARHQHTEHGQFVSNYHASTVLGVDGHSLSEGPLNLDGGVDDWSIDGHTMAAVRAFVADCVTGRRS